MHLTCSFWKDDLVPPGPGSNPTLEPPPPSPFHGNRSVTQIFSRWKRFHYFWVIFIQVLCTERRTSNSASTSSCKS